MNNQIETALLCQYQYNHLVGASDRMQHITLYKIAASDHKKFKLAAKTD